MKWEQQRKTLIQFVKFGLVGVSNTAISLVVYYVILKTKENTDVFTKLEFRKPNQDQESLMNQTLYDELVDS